MVMRRLVATAILPAILAAACGSAAQDQSSATTSSPAIARTNDVLVLGSAGGTSVINASGRVISDLGQVIGAPGWTVAFATDVDGAGNTAVRIIDAHNGKTTRTTQLSGRWTSVAGYGNGPSGLSPNGRWLVLGDPRPDRTVFEIVDTTGPAQPKRLEIPGRYAFEAVSDDRASLFVVERMDGTKYRVRVADVASGVLMPASIIDVKQAATTADANGVMNGSYTTATAGPSGEWYFSVYQHPTQGPYIHALNTHARYAECILDLPTFGKAGAVEMAKQPFWSLALGQQKSMARLYAVHRPLGQVPLLEPHEFKGKQSAVIKAPAPAPGPRALSPRYRAPVSPDGYRLYGLGEKGIL